MSEKCKLALKNGFTIPSYAAIIPADCPSAYYGIGAFEGIHFFSNGSKRIIFRLEDHMKRLIKSANRLRADFNYSLQNLIDQTKLIIEKNEIAEGYVRPVLYFTKPSVGLHFEKETTFFLFVYSWEKYHKNPVNLGISSLVRPHPDSTDLTSKITGTYANSYLATIEAKDKGYDDMLMLDWQGHVAEVTVSNIFIVPNCAMNTVIVPASDSILPGITRDTIIKICPDLGLRAHVQNKITLEKIYSSDEIFVCGTAYKVHPVKSIDFKKLRRINIKHDRIYKEFSYPIDTPITYDIFDIPGPITKNIQRYYLDIAKGKIPQYNHWLTCV